MKVVSGKNLTLYQVVITSAKQGTFNQVRSCSRYLCNLKQDFFLVGGDGGLLKYRLAELSHQPLKYVVDLSN